MNGVIPNCSKGAVAALFLYTMFLSIDYRTSTCIGAEASGHPPGNSYERGSDANDDDATMDYVSKLKGMEAAAATVQDKKVDNDLRKRGVEKLSDAKELLRIAQNGKGTTTHSEGAGQAAELAAETAFWNSVKDSDSAEPFQLYLQKYPEGVFADLARYKLSSLKGTADKDKNAVRVIIYRSDTLYKPSIFINDAEICRLQGKRYVEFILRPGTYTFKSAGDNQIELELKPQEQRFLRVWYGIRKYQIKEVSSEQAQQEMKTTVHNSPEFIFHKGYARGELLDVRAF